MYNRYFNYCTCASWKWIFFIKTFACFGLAHDDVMTWKHFFRDSDPLWGEPPITGGFPSQRASDSGFFSYKTLFLRNYIRLHTASSYQIDGPAKTETIALLMQWNRLSPIPKSSRWYQYIYMQTATNNKHPQTCFNKHNRYVNHIKITVHSIMSLKYMSPSSFHQFCSLLTTCHRDLVMLFYNIAFFPQCMHHKLEYDRYLINRHQPNQRET